MVLLEAVVWNTVPLKKFLHDLNSYLVRIRPRSLWLESSCHLEFIHCVACLATSPQPISALFMITQQTDVSRLLTMLRVLVPKTDRG